MNFLDEQNEEIYKSQLSEVEAGVIEEDQISQWKLASPQDLSWLPED